MTFLIESCPVILLCTELTFCGSTYSKAILWVKYFASIRIKSPCIISHIKILGCCPWKFLWTLLIFYLGDGLSTIYLLNFQKFKVNIMVQFFLGKIKTSAHSLSNCSSSTPSLTSLSISFVVYHCILVEQGRFFHDVVTLLVFIEILPAQHPSSIKFHQKHHKTWQQE